MFPKSIAAKNPKKSGIKNGIFKKSRCFKEKRPESETEKKKTDKEKMAAKNIALMKTEYAKDEKTE